MMCFFDDIALSQQHLENYGQLRSYNTSNQKLTPILVLAEKDSMGKAEADEVLIARLLLDRGADLNARTPTRSDGGYGNETALSLAATQGKAALVELLLARGSDANTIDAQGQTPLMKTAQYTKDDVAVEWYNAKNLANRIKMVRALLAHGAKLDLRDKAGQSAFDMATSPQLKAALKIPPAPTK